MKRFFIRLRCFLFGHERSHGIVDVAAIFSISEMAYEPDHGFADFCVRCHKILSEVSYESEMPPFHPNCRCISD